MLVVNVEVIILELLGMFRDMGLDLSRLGGVLIDGVFVMVGCNSGVVIRFCELCLGILVIYCIVYRLVFFCGEVVDKVIYLVKF